MKPIHSTHYPSPLLVEAMQREVLRNSQKFFSLFREPQKKKGLFGARRSPRLFNTTALNHGQQNFYQ